MKRLHHPGPDVLPSMLLATAAWALVIATKSWWYAIGVTLVLAAHWLLGLRLPGRPRLFTIILLAIPFALWFRYIPAHGFTGFPPVDVLVMGGMYLVALGTYHVLCRKTGGSQQRAIAWALVAIAMAGMAPRSIHIPFAAITAWFMGLMVIALRYRMNVNDDVVDASVPSITRATLRHWILICLSGALLLALSWTVHTQVVSRAPVMGRWLARKLASPLPPDRAGFTRTAMLGSLSANRNEVSDAQVALRVWGTQPDSHLRGAVFDRYGSGVWRQIAESTERRPVGTASGRSLFALIDPASGADDPATWGPPQAIAYPESDLSDAIFLPLGARSLAAFGDNVMTGEALSARSPAHTSAGGYAWYATRSPLSGPTDNDRAVPPELREPLERIAREIMKSERAENAGRATEPAATMTSTQDAMRCAAQLESHFNEHFRYTLGIDPPAGKDPLLYFLEDVRAAHCEYFAAAGALLLRAKGIPARYVTGFVVQERGWSKNLWQARRKDAHAWVEMWVPDRGWVTVDPTPPAGRPSVTSATTGNRLGEWLMGWWVRLWRVIAHAGALGLLTLVWSALLDVLTATPWWVWALLVIGAGLWVYRKELLGHRRGRKTETVTQRTASLRAMLRRAERLGQRAGVPREPWMPVGDYLRLIQEAPMQDEGRRAIVALLDEYQQRRFTREPS